MSLVSNPGPGLVPCNLEGGGSWSLGTFQCRGVLIFERGNDTSIRPLVLFDLQCESRLTLKQKVLQDHTVLNSLVKVKSYSAYEVARNSSVHVGSLVVLGLTAL